VEHCLHDTSAVCLVSRAVGSISQLYSFIEKSSSWKTLLLFKTSTWEKEWDLFCQSQKNIRKKGLNRSAKSFNANPLTVQGIHTYRLPEYTKSFVILRLLRSEMTD
jgi:hypothetical protein